jgi:hypothetical protein
MSHYVRERWELERKRDVAPTPGKPRRCIARAVARLTARFHLLILQHQDRAVNSWYVRSITRLAARRRGPC